MDSAVPVIVGSGNGNPLTNVKAIAAGEFHSLALLSDGTVRAWGAGGNGQMGNGSLSTQGFPSLVGPFGNPLTNVKAIASGLKNSLALLVDGTVRAWGYGSSGQNGNGTLSDSSLPVTVGPSGSPFSNVKAIAGGSFHNLALLTDGSVRTWGYGDDGQLGNGTFALNSTLPVTVGSPGSPLTNVKAIAGGGYHSLALLADGTVRTWGYGVQGQLGNGQFGVGISIPTTVIGLTDVVSISASFYSSYALKADGTLWAWGDNTYGQLGDGTTSSRSTPVQIFAPAGYTFDEISAGGYHMTATVVPVPEPAELLLFIGIVAVQVLRWRL